MIRVHDQDFKPYISKGDISLEIQRIAEQLEEDLQGQIPVFVGVLNGAFMFFSDLMKAYRNPCEVAFIKAASYEGMQSTGTVTFHENGGMNLKGRHVIVVEDIVDTGRTLHALYEHLAKQDPASLKVCTLLFKKEAYKEDLPIDYVCFETENKFLLGYGLDYDGHGRNLPEVYILNQDHD